MGWSSATREEKTAVALLNLTGWDIWWESRGTSVEATVQSQARLR